MKTIKFTLCLSLFFVNAYAFETAVYDSLRTETVNGQSYILHRVDSKETLYSLLKRYKCSDEQFRQANPAIGSSNGINVDQLLKFPIEERIMEQKAAVVIAQEKPQIAEQRTLDQKTDIQPITNKKVSFVHHVRPSETLYSICKQYQVDVDEVKALNKLVDNEISIGQALMIRKSVESYQEISTLGMVIDKTPVNNALPEKLTPTKVYVPDAPKGERVTETGIAEVIALNKNSKKMLALHKTAPFGSLMLVKNSATGNQVVVKVIGKLPDTGNNENIMVRLSPSAFYKLNPKDIRIRAQVTYYLPPNS